MTVPRQNYIANVSAQGYDLQYALGLGTTWFTVSRAH